MRKRDRVKLRELRDGLRAARARRRERVRDVRTLCRSESRRLAEERKQRAIDAREAEKARRVQRREQDKRLRLEQREECRSDRARAKLEGDTSVTAAAAALQLERERQDEDRQFQRAYRKVTGRRGMSSREQLEHSDDEVRANLPPELLGVWEKFKHKVRPDARRSRTEVFLEYVHDHPEVIVEHVLEDERQYVQQLEKAERELVRDMKKKKPAGNRQTRRERDARDAAAFRADLEEWKASETDLDFNPWRRERQAERERADLDEFGG